MGSIEPLPIAAIACWCRAFTRRPAFRRGRKQLKETILRELPSLAPNGEKLLVVGHSLGGLDARYMVSKLDMAKHVSAVLTVSCPHRGTPYADWWLHHIGRRLGGLQLMALLGLDVQALTDLTTTTCKRFNEEVPDAPGVRYYSISGSRPWHRVPAFAMHAHRVVHRLEGENDGLVSVKSSTWGEHLGIWPADHFHTINKRLVLEINEPTGDIAPFYIRAIDEVAAREAVPKAISAGGSSATI